MRILIVDDEIDLLTALRRGVRAQGIEADVCVDAATAEAFLATAAATGTPYAAVLSDYHLGDGTTGADVLKAAREVSPATRRLLMTGEGAEAVAALVMNGLAEQGFSKPFDVDELCKVLRACPA